MRKGIRITQKSNIPYAQLDDFVIDTTILGSLKIHERRTIIPNVDGVLVADQEVYVADFNHGLDFTPAVIGFSNGILVQGWQQATIPDTTCHANPTRVRVTCDKLFGSTPVYVIVFGEKIVD